MWDYREGTDLWIFDWYSGVTWEMFSPPLFYSFCAFNPLWVERQFSEASPSYEVDVPYIQGFLPSWKLLLAVLTLIHFSDRVSWSTKTTSGRQTVCASGCNKELDSSWCGGSAQWAIRHRMVSLLLLLEFKSQQHIGRWLWCEPLSTNSQPTEREGKGRSLRVIWTSGFWLEDSEGCDSIFYQPE